MRENIRIPVFNKDFLFNIYDKIEITDDIPDVRWIDQNWKPQKNCDYVGPRYDPIAMYEINRVLKYRTCPYCRTLMKNISKYPGEDIFDNVVLVCENCFYWAGRGASGDDPLSIHNRGILSRINFVENPDDEKLNILINYLNNNINRLVDLTPRQAEKLLPSVLSDYLKCEVMAFGGVKDKGIDALAIRSDDCKILIQIKWREDINKSENVAVVREVAGTLLARKIPNGLIISTRKKYSKDAVKEAELISQTEIVDIGKINLQLKDFNNLIDMFEISAKIRKENMTIEDYIGLEDDFYLFDFGCGF